MLFLLIASAIVSALPALADEYLQKVDGIYYIVTYDPETYTGEARVWGADPEEIPYPDNVDSICHILDEVDGWPVRKIDQGALRSSTAFISVSIPNTIDTIGECAFAGSSIRYFMTYDPYPHHDPSTGLVISDNAFDGCKQLESVRFDVLVSKIGNKAFRNCEKLTSFDLNYYEDVLTSMGFGSFAGCSSLTRFNIPETVTEIGKGAFLYCSALEDISIPASVTSLGEYAFAECSSLSNVYFNCNLSTIGEATFLRCTNLNYIYLPASVTTIEDYAFHSCSSLQYIQLGNNLTSIGNRAFAGCHGLTSINIPNSVTTIGNEAFFGCFAGVGLWGPESLNSLSDDLIQLEDINYSGHLGSLKNIKIGSNVNSIGAQAFLGQVPDKITCMAPWPPVLQSGEWSDRYGSFDEMAYDSTMLCVPKVLVDVYKTTDGWKNFMNIEGIEIMGNGDSNGDGQTDISDVAALIDALLGNNNIMPVFHPVNADIDGDGSISIIDVSCLIDKLLNH